MGKKPASALDPWQDVDIVRNVSNIICELLEFTILKGRHEVLHLDLIHSPHFLIILDIMWPVTQDPLGNRDYRCCATLQCIVIHNFFCESFFISTFKSLAWERGRGLCPAVPSALLPGNIGSSFECAVSGGVWAYRHMALKVLCSRGAPTLMAHLRLAPVSLLVCPTVEEQLLSSSSSD